MNEGVVSLLLNGLSGFSSHVAGEKIVAYPQELPGSNQENDGI